MEDGNEIKPKDSKSARLIQLYLRVNQFAYAITAFPIGTVLSVAPIYLKRRGAPVKSIGYFMAGGELLGIGAMVLAEHYEEGFIFRRPYDLYFINASLALVLILIAVWPENVWYVSAIFMMLVQTFNSASKPVVSEAIHRLSIMTSRESHTVFAEANAWRRVGNATIGLATPLLYAGINQLPFYLIGGIMIFYLAVVYGVDFKIKMIYHRYRKGQMNRMNDAIGNNNTVEGDENSSLFAFSERVTTERVPSTSPKAGRRVSESLISNEGAPEGSRIEKSWRKRRISTISLLKSYRRRQTSEDSDKSAPKEVKLGSKNLAVSALGNSGLGAVVEEDGDEEDSGQLFAPKNGVKFDATTMSGVTPLSTIIEKGKNEPSSSLTPAIEEVHDDFGGFEDTFDRISYYLIVWMFPFFDAVITRLPFSYLMIAIVETDGLGTDGLSTDGLDTEKKKRTFYAAIGLFGYQIGRAISQQIQVWRCDTLVNYLMNIIALSGYIAFVIYVEVASEGKWWFLPILVTGFSETLPIQQLYLCGLFGDLHPEDMALRNAVKASHTWTGVGSMVAFIVGSQIYEQFGHKGMAYMGLVVMILKIAVNVQIDILHDRKEKKTKRPLRGNLQTYQNMFRSMHFGDTY